MGDRFGVAHKPLRGLPTRRSRDRWQVKVGAEDWNRTSDTSIFSAVLYQLSYLGPDFRQLVEPQSYQLDHAIAKTHRDAGAGRSSRNL